jgi:hypothetical protein
MPTQYQMMHQHPALGGLDISSDPTVLDPGFLTIADNIEYLEGGQRKKRLGTTIYSTSTGNTNTAFLVSSSTPVRAVEDFWRYGASLTPSQNLVSVAGASIFSSTGDGRWTAITTASSFGQASNTKTFITLAGDFAVISDETATPIAYNQAVLSGPSTGAAWPRFTHSRYHLARLFMGGISTAPSQVNYSGAGNIFDSTGTDTGLFNVSAGDGDQVNGISDPFFASLYIFKGPNKGSIWQLSGNTPATFSLVQIGYGAPLLNPRALVTTPTDVYWLSQYGIHSLETTVKFGNVEQAFLSLPIQRLWRDNLIQRASLANAWSFWHPTRNIVGWCVTPSGDTTSRWILCYNYALSDPKPGGKKFWSIWKFPSFGLTCGEVMLTPATWDALLGSPRSAGYPVPMFGGDNGTVYGGDARILGDAGQAYTAQVRTPIISRFKTDKGQSVPETQEKLFAGVVTYINPKGNYTADLTISVDQRLQSTTISLVGAGNTLG